MNRSTSANLPQVTPLVNPSYGEDPDPPTIIKGKRNPFGPVKGESSQRLKTIRAGLGPPPLPPPLELTSDDRPDEQQYFKHDASFPTSIQQPVQHEATHRAPTSSTDLLTADFQGGYLDLVSGTSFINRVCQRLNQDKTSTGAGQAYSSLYTLDFTLPPLERALEMVETYFEYAVVTYRFLHRGHVEQWLRQIYQSNILTTNLPTDLMVGRCCIVYSFLAIGTLYERRAPESGVDYDEQSLYLLASSRASECWFAFGTTVQFLTALNMHRKWPSTMVKEGKGTYIEQELWKRTFWSVCTLDKYLSVMFGRPRLLHDEDFDQELPDEVADPDLLINEPSMRSGVADDVMIASVLHYRQKTLIHGFWFTHYVCFCAVTVVYIHIIKQYQASSTGAPPNKKVENSSQLQYLFSLAETCQQHLRKATSRSSPNRRYGIILEQLRLEVHRQVVSSLRPGAQVETEDDSHKDLSKADSFLPPSFDPTPVTAVSPKPHNMAFDALPADLFASHLVDDSIKLYDSFGFPDNSDTSAWWVQLDSWAYTDLSEEPSIFRF
ncbi:uncharacterized protein N7498_002798 [Penicillium cinerascens]|uniref:Xylanolytic transcriptional activator regulatory domain-containing protein n=1 Tax=Penicillium cinerascens TaxID=70096 RepID=A0A9W9NAU6_9EURO|nr:uncharacterized protein N7498_002798 [Penicillium cinerascens]KAJ5216391.1 hypothetical protein N7498_002798 [Penicillium cinerascens]